MVKSSHINPICIESSVVQTYLDGFFTEAEEEIVLKHINNCSACFGVLLDQAREERPIIEFFAKNLHFRQIIRSRAAGVSENLPAQIAVPKNFINQEDMAIKFEQNSRELRISLIGGSIATRRQIKLQMHYNELETDILEGKNIIRGGVWKIDLEKANQISCIVVLCEG